MTPDQSTDAEFFISRSLPPDLRDICRERILLIIGVEISPEGLWHGEAYFLISDAAYSHGSKITEPMLDPRTENPGFLAEKISLLRELAESMVRDAILKERGTSPEARRQYKDVMHFDPLPESKLALLHLGKFRDPIIDLLSNTRCTSICEFLTTFEAGDYKPDISARAAQAQKSGSDPFILLREEGL
jgi:hypothetical protein